LTISVHLVKTVSC